MEMMPVERSRKMNFILGFGCAAIIAGIAYVVIASGLFDFLRGKW